MRTRVIFSSIHQWITTIVESAPSVTTGSEGRTSDKFKAAQRAVVINIHNLSQ